jgi:endoglucanase
MVTISRSMLELGKETVSGKAMDDRAAVAVIYECLQQLSCMHHVADVYAAATVQEEVGLRGAAVSAYGIAPDIGIALDVCHGAMPGVSEQDTSPMGKGPSVGYGANIHPKVHTRLIETAKEYNIPYSLEVYAAGTGTDLWAMQVTRAGIPTGLISIPSRYMHTSVETVNLSDLKMAGRLLAQFIASIDAAFVEGLLCY